MTSRRLKQLLAELGPDVTPADAEPTSADMEELARIMSHRVVAADLLPESTRRRRWWPIEVVAVAAVAVLVVVLTVVPGLGHETSARAVTPAALEFSGSPSTRAEVLKMLDRLAVDTSGQSEPERRASYSGWYVQIGHDAEGNATSTAISPQEVTFEWHADGSADVVTRAGTPYWADASTGTVPASAAPAAGTLLSESVYKKGEFELPDMAPPGTTEDALLQTLIANGMPAQPTSMDIMVAIESLKTIWTLTAAQDRILLRLLLTRSDVAVRGTGHDRNGRPAVAITAAPHRGFKVSLLISAETGRILGVETARTTLLDGIPPGAVISYTSWKDTK